MREITGGNVTYTSWRIACTLVSAALLLTLAGVAAAQQAAAKPNPAGLHPKAGQLSASGAAGMRYTNPVDHVTFPVPSGFMRLKLDDPKEFDSIHLGDSAPCKVDVAREGPTHNVLAVQQGIQRILGSKGVDVKIVGPARLGSYDASRLHAIFKNGVTEDYYTVTRNDTAVTLIVIMGPACHADFAPTIKGFAFN